MPNRELAKQREHQAITILFGMARRSAKCLICRMRHNKRWSALTKFTEAGDLDASNNYAERCMRAVAVGKNAFPFVGSERAGHATAIYCSLVESCKASQVNPLTHLTCILSIARDRAVVLPTPDEFATLSTAPVGGCVLGESGVGSPVRQDADYRTASLSRTISWLQSDW